MSEATVICHSGYTYAQEPRAVIWDGQPCLVALIVDRWRTPTGPGFRIVAEGGQAFHLQYDEQQGHWAVLLLDEFGRSSSPSPGESRASAGRHHIP